MSAPKNQKLQFLGLAFCAADLVFEIDGRGLISLALGAAEQLAGTSAAEMQGLHWSDLMGPDEADLLAAMLENLRPGERQGPIRVRLAPRAAGRLDRHANLSVFRLPQNGGSLSCALSVGDAAPTAAVTRHGGLIDRAAFETAMAAAIAEAAASGSSARLALVQLGGLTNAMSGLDGPQAEEARRKIAAALRLESQAGVGAAEIADERFALVRSASTSVERLTQRIRQICGEAVTTVTAELVVGGDAPEQGLRAVRYALDRYIAEGADKAADGFESMLTRTAEESVKFRAALTGGAFHVVYQPVVQLGDRGAHHYEALTRFEGTESPAAAIQLAEELGLIMELDFAVAKTVVGVLDADPQVKIAANISAVSLMNPRFIASLVTLTARAPKLRPRLLFEITETHTLADLADAGRVVASLRELGHPVCLDDFGAGAATLEYLSRLEVDFIKFDGRYIKSLDRQPRDSAVIKHVVALCRELGIGTIAEMIETEEVAQVARRLGVALGQGWLYGKPTLTISNPVQRPAASVAASTARPAARRRGATETWG